MIVKKYTRFPSELIDDTKIPVFCTAAYARYLTEAKSQDVFWLAGFKNDKMICIIPFSIVKKLIFKKGCFLTATLKISSQDEFCEKEFLDTVVQFIKNNKTCDWIEQPPNWALFKAVPSNSIFCEFGTYRINLEKYDETELFGKMEKDKRRSIKKAMDSNFVIQNGPECLEDCLQVFSRATAEGNHTLPKKKELENLIYYLPENIRINVAYNNGNPQSCLVLFINNYSVYGEYAGRIASSSRDINSFLMWETIKEAKKSGVKYFDFGGARINPEPGSKPEKIQNFKEHFGGELVKGFLWKMPISKFKYFLYDLSLRSFFLLSLNKYEGDIIDQELKRK